MLILNPLFRALGIRKFESKVLTRKGFGRGRGRPYLAVLCSNCLAFILAVIYSCGYGPNNPHNILKYIGIFLSVIISFIVLECFIRVRKLEIDRKEKSVDGDVRNDERQDSDGVEVIYVKNSSDISSLHSDGANDVEMASIKNSLNIATVHSDSNESTPTISPLFASAVPTLPTTPPISLSPDPSISIPNQDETAESPIGGMPIDNIDIGSNEVAAGAGVNVWMKSSNLLLSSTVYKDIGRKPPKRFQCFYGIKVARLMQLTSLVFVSSFLLFTFDSELFLIGLDSVLLPLFLIYFITHIGVSKNAEITPPGGWSI